MEQPPFKRLKCNGKSNLPVKDIRKRDYAIKQVSDADPFDVAASVASDIEEVMSLGSLSLGHMLFA